MLPRAVRWPSLLLLLRLQVQIFPKAGRRDVQVFLPFEQFHRRRCELEVQEITVGVPPEDLVDVNFDADLVGGPVSDLEPVAAHQIDSRVVFDYF